jgi:malate dehydrogenase (oxaloacetate-decarboxylating)(NADP+)
MKIAAAKALAALAKEDVPDQVINAYGGERFSFGPDYIIPKPFDARVLMWEAPAVARAAVETGVARHAIEDWDEYVASLERRILGKSHQVIRGIVQKARRARRRKIVFPEATEEKVLRACQVIVDENVAEPVLVGNPEEIVRTAEQFGLELDHVQIVDVRAGDRAIAYANELHSLRQRSGVTPRRARQLMNDPLHFGIMMVNAGEADGLVGGLNRSYPDTIRPALQIIGLRKGITRAAGVYCVVLMDRLLIIADATVNIEPTSDQLAEIALMAANVARYHFDMTPRVAMLSFSNFGSVDHPHARKVREATAIARARQPALIIDGEMQADTALVPEIVEKTFPHSAIKGDANVLIFPDLQSGNIAYKLIQHLAKAELIGPILVGLRKPVNVVNHYSSVSEIVNITAITTVMANAG